MHAHRVWYFSIDTKTSGLYLNNLDTRKKGLRQQPFTTIIRDVCDTPVEYVLSPITKIITGHYISQIKRLVSSLSLVGGDKRVIYI